jgi:nucleotide-binding universal stress UspA family protein
LRNITTRLVHYFAEVPSGWLKTLRFLLARTLPKQSQEEGKQRSPLELMRIEHILCPTDLSPAADEALRYAFALALACESSLTALHCTRAGSESGLPSGAANQLLAQTLLRRLVRAEQSVFDWEAVVTEDDDVGAAITREAAERGADLIVIRSRRRPHRAALLGSTAESVCRTAGCPVLVTHADEREWVGETTPEIDLKRVLVAYDFSDYSELALNYGLSLAQENQAELHLLHVLPPFSLAEPEIAWYPIGDEGTYHKAARRLQQAVSGEAHLWCDVKHAVSEGQPYREILNYTERNDIDLICIGAQGAGFGMRTLFGSNVDRVLRQARCPVLVARPLKHAKLGLTKPNASVDDEAFVPKGVGPTASLRSHS